MSRKKRDKTIRIKYYGLISVSKRGYLLSSAVTLAILGIGLVLGYAAGILPPLSTLWGVPWPWAQLTPWPWVYQYLYWFILVGLIAEVVITVRMLRRFAVLEAEQQARQVKPTSAPEEAKT
jgi:hypothetical protein